MPGDQEPDLLHRVATHGAAGDELCLEARQELFNGGKSPRQEGVYVPSLRYGFAALARRWEDLSLKDRDLVEVVRDCACSQEAGDARADHHRVVCVCPSWVQHQRTRPTFVGGNPLFRRQMAYGEGGGLASALQVELGEHVADMMLDRLRSDEEPRGDLSVGQTFAQ